MNIDKAVKTLLPICEPDDTIVTLSLDLAGTGTLSQATRRFLKDVVESNLLSQARPPAAQSVLRKITRRINDLVEKGLEAASKGLYLVAGREIWMPLEFKAPAENLIVTGPRPYLPPLLALQARSPLGYLVQVEENTLEIQEVQFGDARSVFKVHNAAPVDDREHHSARGGMKLSTPGGRGGAERDRRQQRENESFRTLVRDGVQELCRLHTSRPAAAVFLAGSRDLHSEMDRHLPEDLRKRVKVLGSPGGSVVQAIRELGVMGKELVAAQTLQFHEARAEGRVALGPNDVLNAVWSGRAGRIYLDESNPIPGVVCTGCGVHRPGLELRCPFCAEEVKSTSIAQDVVAYALSHNPAVGLTFVGSDSGWLRDLGGMAVLLATKGARSRKTVAIR